MYAPFFGLNKEPFSIAPDPRFLFMSEQHREALAHLLYGLSGGGGFVLLTGEIGAGKTTVCRCFLEQVPAHCAVAYVFNPKLTAIELLQTVCHEFGILPPTDSSSLKAHVDALNSFLLGLHAEGRQAVLVIDEAQALSADVLEQLRLLTNLETTERKLLQIVLIGQPELRGMLARPELEQLAQRVIARYHLGPLDLKETQAYIRHRLAVAGPNAALPFDQPALARIHRLSGGVPRRINLLADRALLGAYAQSLSRADRRTVEQAAREVFATGEASVRLHGWGLAATAGLLALGAAAAWSAWQMQRERPGAAVTGSQQPADAVAARRDGAGAASAGGLPAAALAVAGSVVPVGAATPGLAASEAAARLASGAASGLSSASSGASTSKAASAPGALAGAVASSDPTALLGAAHPDAATAWRELALRWNVAIGEGDPCVAAQQAQLACFRSPPSGGLPAVRQLARPGVLTLRNTEGQPRYAVLVGLTDRQATLHSAGRGFVLGLPALASVWRGEFATFWRTPPGWAEGGARSSTWVEQQLPPAAAGPGQPLRERIHAFQLAEGLPPDGLAGPMTLMRLNRVAGVDEPRLGGAD